MPIYDYACSACGRVTEVIHGIHDHGPRFCPECGAEGTMRKALSTPAIVFKGSGWAKVDRRSSSGSRTSTTATKPGAGKKEGAGDGAGDGSTSAAKPASPAESASAGTGDGGRD